MRDPARSSASSVPPTIVVGTDFTAQSRAAFDAGLRMAKEDGARLVLVHAVRPLGAPGLELTRPDTTGFENETAPPAGAPVPAGAASVAGGDWADYARSQGVDAEVVVRPGFPANVLAEEADRLAASAVVLGTSRKEAAEAAVLGSVAAAVRKATDRPVHVVPNAADVKPERPASTPSDATADARTRGGAGAARDGADVAR